MVKIIGAVLVVAGCGGCGFSMAAAQKGEEQQLRQLLRAVEFMQWELQFRQSPLPELCAHTGQAVPGAVGAVFTQLSRELEKQLEPEAGACLETTLNAFPRLPERVKEALRLLGSTLGRFDLTGQQQGLSSVAQRCREGIGELSENRASRLRGYQTLGLCAGAALAILFL